MSNYSPSLETKRLYHCLKQLIEKDLKKVVEPISTSLQEIRQGVEELTSIIEEYVDAVLENQ